MNKAYLSIGSNIGVREKYLQQAIQQLTEQGDITVEKVSSIYETAPVGYTDQANFLNLVLALTTSKTAHQLLAICQQIEQVLGRERTIRWGPRTVDLDILLFNNEVIETEDLIVPHPRMEARGFVLIPLLEIEPDCRHPKTGKKYAIEEAAKDPTVEIWEGQSNS